MAAIQSDDASAIGAIQAADAAAFATVLHAHHPQDELKRTPLMLAYWWGQPLAAKALVNAGADYLQADAAGNGAAWYARRFGNGAAQEAMSRVIDAEERRLSMEKVIDGGPSIGSQEPGDAGAPPLRRRKSL